MGTADAIKRISRITGETGQPVQIMFGMVVSESPVSVKVDNGMLLAEKQLIIPKALKKGYSDTHKHRLAAPDGAEPVTGDVKDGTAESHTHTLKDDYWTNNAANTLKEREYYYGLKSGESVILLRDAGGQRFLVLGRL